MEIKLKFKNTEDSVVREFVIENITSTMIKGDKILTPEITLERRYNLITHGHEDLVSLQDVSNELNEYITNNRQNLKSLDVYFGTYRFTTVELALYKIFYKSNIIDEGNIENVFLNEHIVFMLL